jgi:hypothetical protein
MCVFTLRRMTKALKNVNHYRRLSDLEMTEGPLQSHNGVELHRGLTIVRVLLSEIKL